MIFILIELLLFSSAHNHSYGIYSTKNTFIAEDIQLTSTLIERRLPISFIIEFKTYVNQHPKELPIIIKCDDVTVLNYTSKVLSPKEMYFTFDNPIGKRTINISISIENSIGGSVMVSKQLRIVEIGDLEIVPDFDELEENIKSFQRMKRFSERFLKNDSFAMSVKEKLSFRLDSSKYNFLSVTVVKRLHHPSFCIAEEYLNNIGSTCQNNTLPVIKISENKTKMVFDPQSIGVYTIIVYVGDKITTETFYQTVNITNFLIVEEPIQKVCARYINRKNKETVLLSGVKGLNIAWNINYHWTQSNQFEVTTCKL